MITCKSFALPVILPINDTINFTELSRRESIIVPYFSLHIMQTAFFNEGASSGRGGLNERSGVLKKLLGGGLFERSGLIVNLQYNLFPGF